MMNRPTQLLTELQKSARLPEEVMDPAVLGASRQTRHSFARSLVRHASTQGWKISRRIWELDEDGRGMAVYSVAMGKRTIELILFSHVIDETLRTDRVIAQDWDITAALVNGMVSPEHIETLSRNVTKQEDGRADVDTLIWARANRSQRFFGHIVDRLSQGLQPEAAQVSDSAYIIRSTAFYGNGKFGLMDFDGLSVEHPLSTPYRAQMLAAWLLREFSLDLVEHCAQMRSSSAAKLDKSWKRFIGIGNATGLGMVPYPIRHPQVLDAWVATRELPLANIYNQKWQPDSPQVARVVSLVTRSIQYFSAKKSFSTEPYPSGPELSESLNEVLALLMDFANTGSIQGQKIDFPAKSIHQLAQQISLETGQIIESILIEIDSSLDSEIEQLLICKDRTFLDAQMTVGELTSLVNAHYSWTKDFDFSRKKETERFWFYSLNNQEPRRGLRGKDRGLKNEHPVGVGFDISELRKSLTGVASEQSVGEFVVHNPQHWGIVERIQSVAGLPYSEARINPLSGDFLPLDLQRFQLAIYGMENFNPQSTDWLRVTLYEGAPTVSDLNTNEDLDDWLFLPRPGASA